MTPEWLQVTLPEKGIQDWSGQKKILDGPNIRTKTG